MNQSQFDLSQASVYLSDDSYPDAHIQTQKFQNILPPAPMTAALWGKMIYRHFFGRTKDSRPHDAVPVHTISSLQLQFAPVNSLYRLGHSSLLLKLSNGFWLTDPVLSDRASPVSWAGPKRFHQPPLSVAELPPLKGVLISHNHYDHLDKATIQALKGRCERFYVPLGVGKLLQRWGVKPKQIKEFQWWQSAKIGDVTLVSTPSRHFSGRGLHDRDRSLWCSWVIRSTDFSVFFSGDSGYCREFQIIGEHYGPFDITCIETGAYDDIWSDVHMFPEQSLQAHLDLKGRYFMPIHNGTFDLAFHDWFEPFDRITALSLKAKVSLLIPEMGQPVHLEALPEFRRWWHLSPEQVVKPYEEILHQMG